MLRVRVVSPASLTGQLVERLTAAHGVQNLVVLRGAVRAPFTVIYYRAVCAA